MAAVALMGAFGAQGLGLAQSPLLHRPAPQFARRDFRGDLVSLRALRGKVVLLNFWATWCAPCQLELPRFAAWQRQYGGEGLAVVAISMDDEARQPKALAHKLGLDFPVAMGDAALARRYGGVLGLPVTFLIARDGTVAARYDGEVDLGAMETQVRKLLAAR